MAAGAELSGCGVFDTEVTSTRVNSARDRRESSCTSATGTRGEVCARLRVPNKIEVTDIEISKRQFRRINVSPLEGRPRRARLPTTIPLEFSDHCARQRAARLRSARFAPHE